MREIKFRVFWSDTKKAVKDFNEQYLIDACNDDHFEVHQFTGLKDKNGVEIYEGDILSGSTSGVVQFSRGKFCGYYYDSSGSLSEEWEDDLYHHASKLEVIGNIYENINLIKDDSFSAGEEV